MNSMMRRIRGNSRTRHRRALALAAAAATTIALTVPQAASAASSAPGAGADAKASLTTALQDTTGKALANSSNAPQAPAGWKTQFVDNFTGPARGAPTQGKWMYDTGPGSSFGTGEIETMTSSRANSYLNGHGDLHMTALGSGSTWTSSRLQTTSANVGAPVGGKLEVTASIKQPNPSSGVGYWPAFWMLGPGQWPENGEIDILEDVNALSELSGTVHCGTDPGGPCNEPDGVGSGLVACPSCQTGFNTYTMVLNRTYPTHQSITFYLDGTKYFKVNESTVGRSTWHAAFDHHLSIILDLAMGGSYPNGVCGCTSPTSSTTSGGTMSVNYVAAYVTNG